VLAPDAPKFTGLIVSGYERVAKKRTGHGWFFSPGEEWGKLRIADGGLIDKAGFII
jgi:hypothetical protein